MKSVDRVLCRDDGVHGWLQLHETRIEPLWPDCLGRDGVSSCVAMIASCLEGQYRSTR